MNYITSDKIVTTSSAEKTRSKYGGISDKIMATVNGKEVMIKGDKDSESYCEYMASNLGQYLGLYINKVDLIDCGDLYDLNKLCSVHYMESSFQKFANLSGREEARIKSSVQYKNMRFFDLIIYNEDRHQSNFGIVKDKELFLIDNGLSSPWVEFNPNKIGYSNATGPKDTMYNWSLLKCLDERDLVPIMIKFAKMSDYMIRKYITVPEYIAQPKLEERKSLRKVGKRLRGIRNYLRRELLERGYDYKTYSAN